MNEMSAPTIVQFSSKWMGFIGGFLAISVTFVVCAQTLIPYFYVIPDANSATIGQQQTMFQTVFLMVVSFFFGASMGSRSKDETIAAQAATASVIAGTARAALVAANPDTSKDVHLAPGESATATADLPPKADALVKPTEVSQSDWDAMTDVDKAAVVLRYAK